MQFDREKLKTVILYACVKCGPTLIGAVKLHKVLYYSDMLQYARSGAPITGATYRKRALGPTCDNLPSTLRELERSNAIEVREVDYFGYRKKEYEAIGSPDIERLSIEQRELLDEIIDFVCFDNTAKTISEYSHNRAWELAEFGEILPYRSVFHLFPTEVSKESLDWAASEAENIEPQRSRRISVETTDYEDFRNRILEARG